MAKKRITDITVERTALLTTDYIAGDSKTGTNNTCRISTPNLLAQLRDGPTTPTFQVKLSTLATAGLGGVSRLARGFDIHLTNPKATTAAVEYGLQVASSDAASPLALRFAVKTDATATSRYGSIEVDDAGTKRPLILQPTSGFVGIGTTDALAPLHVNTTGATALSVNSVNTGTGIGNMSTMFVVNPDQTANNWAGILFSDGSVSAASGGVGLQFKDKILNYGELAFAIRDATGFSEKLRIAALGNIGISTTTFGAGAVKVMAFGNGTIPGTIADGFQMVSADIVAGNAAPHFVTEAGPVIRLYQQAGIADPAGGGTIDAEARTAINAILAVLENLRFTAIA